MVEAVGNPGAVHDFPCRAGTERATLSLLHSGEDPEGHGEQTWATSWPLEGKTYRARTGSLMMPFR